MTIRTGQGGTVSFQGTNIPQVTGWYIREGETQIDDPDTSDTEIQVNVQFDRGLAPHRLAKGITGTISIVPSSGVTAFTVAEAEFVGREITGETRQVLTAVLHFRSFSPVSF